MRNWEGHRKINRHVISTKFSEIAPNIAFPEFSFHEFYYSSLQKNIHLHVAYYSIHTTNGVHGGQDRTKGSLDGCLTLKLAVNAELLWGNCIAMKNGQKIRPKRPDTDIKLKF